MYYSQIRSILTNIHTEIFFFDGKDHGIEFYALIQADAYNERLFSVSSEEPTAKQAYLQENIGQCFT